MNNPNASSCLHFTKTMSTLKLILKNGLRHSYAFEEFPKNIIQNLINECSGNILGVKPFEAEDDWGIAIPMVSFCDIPITRANNHSKDYGKYVIGLDKRFLLEKDRYFFNPVIYVNSDFLKEAIAFFTSERLRTTDRILHGTKNNATDFDATSFTDKNDCQEILKALPMQFQQEFEQRANETFYSYILLSLYKPIYGKDTYGKDRMFYDEREWRRFLPNTDEFSWLLACTRKEFLETKKSLNDQIATSEDAYLQIPCNCWDAITHIIVKHEYQREALIDYILNSRKLFGCQIEKDEKAKLKLIGRITSFEQINKDY